MKNELLPSIKTWLSISCVSLLLSIPSAVGASADPAYYKAPAKNGDGVLSLMRRYQLADFSCNIERFYELNRLSRNAALLAGREYLLPILIYEFNGQSIRSTIGVDNWEMALAIQRYNEEMLSSGHRSQSYRDDRQLWVPHHALYCAAETVPVPPPSNNLIAAPTNRTFPIFGNEYAYVPLLSSQLSGQVFYISAGHGGPDPGAIGHRDGNRLCEDEYAYDVALRLCRQLLAHGATAYMIIRDKNDGIRNEQFLVCDEDEVQWGDQPINLSQRVRLTERSDIINDLYRKHQALGARRQVALMIHVDSRSVSEQTDLFFYHQENSELSQRMAQRMHQTMASKYARYQANRGYQGTVSTRNLHMLRECLPTSVYIELANIRNSSDQRRIIQTRNRQLLADWLFEGLLER